MFNTHTDIDARFRRYRFQFLIGNGARKYFLCLKLRSALWFQFLIGNGALDYDITGTIADVSSVSIPYR